ncbi:uncharacterized protein PITG_15389 [Phytophthora infestans T30-4]|uniref:CCHC-type domain-containing protein n=1 Tax=Phytophthora infestans (strain T30-4) TaxID=403677 RepID=D0NR48_PHYIT|nr:uncharacterized protein PITG_15389 [Phytophthora infestans T30-4]EEY63170.1 hypothetical protein PITG_15389 [Phytophthora infestans T30-4]|eukprot:XP_002898347.1 hypothetical protein PITG_15389 [Phytophthora infestans T30-4]
MDQAVKHEMSHFGGERRPRNRIKRNVFTVHNRSYKPGHYAPTEQTKEGPVCYHCEKSGHFKCD